MNGIGGNIAATIQTYTLEENAIGEKVKKWADVQRLTGWLDLSGGSSNYVTYSAKVQESTHVFISDFVPLPAAVTAENARMTIGGKAYDIMLIDNPMEMGAGSQLEIFLKYTGGA